MPLSDVLAAALSRPAGHVVEGPVRTIVTEILQDHGYASPAEVQAVRDQVEALARRVAALEGVLSEGKAAAEATAAEVARLQEALGVAEERAAEAQALAMAADARSAALVERTSSLEAQAAHAERRASMAESRLEEAMTIELNTADMRAVELPEDDDEDEPEVQPEEQPEVAAPDGRAAAAAVPSHTQATCAVANCAALSVTDGFCLAHHQDWIAGRLTGHVSPEGLVEVDGEAFSVDPEHAGKAYVVSGKKLRRVRIEGSFVKKKRL